MIDKHTQTSLLDSTQTPVNEHNGAHRSNSRPWKKLVEAVFPALLANRDARAAVTQADGKI
jgi:hypothetical protein